MEDKIIETFDNLTIKQTDRFLDDNIELKMNGRTFSRIKNKVYKKIGAKTQKRMYMQKRLAACAMVIVVLFSSLALVGFDNVAAMVGNLFTFIPGIGIEPKVDEVIYTIEPVVIKTQADGMTASIIRAVYSDNYLSVTVEIDGKAVYNNDFTFYINNKLTDHKKDNMINLAVASDSTMLNFSCIIEEPKEDDVYEVVINGFPEQLSFKMIPCLDYDEIKKIGSSDIKNNISITTTSQMIDNELVIWVYPFKTSDAVKDIITGYGSPSNGSFILEKYIETESGKVFENRSGWNLSNRYVFEMPEGEQKATLYIPYLSMLRKEKKKLNVNLPKEYTTTECNISIKTSLGIIKVVEITREPNEYNKDKDQILLKFAFDSNNNNKALNSFAYETDNGSVAKKFNPESGCLEYLLIEVEKSQKKFSLDITHLSYYLFGEYVIPLDIK